MFLKEWHSWLCKILDLLSELGCSFRWIYKARLAKQGFFSLLEVFVGKFKFPQLCTLALRSSYSCLSVLASIFLEGQTSHSCTF